MAEHSKILVTGATGTVGRQVVGQLSAAGLAVRALTRRPAAAGLPGSVEVLGGELSVPDTVTAALDGVASVFLVWPFASAGNVSSVIDVTAERARRVVYLSSVAVRDHERRVEDLITRSGLEWTFLRPTVFAANTLRWAAQVRADGILREPFGAAAMAPIHEHDIAAVAVRALTGDEHVGATYGLTGPQLLTHAEQAHIIGEEIGRPVRWMETSLHIARQRMLARGWPVNVVDEVLHAQADMVRNPGQVTADVEKVTGVAARPFRQWAADHADDFR
jgi:uncharacterized protein YbjT (DUF2867 family)